MRSKNIRTCSSMFFLNQEINPATTSNPESKSMNKGKYKKMKVDTNSTRGAHGSGRFGFGLNL